MRLSLFAFATLATLVSAGETGLRRHLKWKPDQTPGNGKPDWDLKPDWAGGPGGNPAGGGSGQPDSAGNGGNTCDADGGCEVEPNTCTFTNMGTTKTKYGSTWCLVYKKQGGQEHCIEVDKFFVDKDADGVADEGSGCFVWTTDPNYGN
jgi:hypothetical protein